ncbi:MAG: hypothetical protein COA54_14670 [Thiotrichaceae bacterium]|nr:MAG: hypothetical protein COA54_14670 [Thiotrichaceae bacterium]
MTIVKQPSEPEDISIVMAVYNHETTVSEALESALMQEMPYKSMIYCLNDASTDRSGEILDAYEKRYPDRIKVFTSPSNLGSGKKSFLYHQPPVKGKYWCLLAGDDYWTTRDKLAKQIAFLDTHPDFVGCSCNTVMKNETSGEESIIQPSRNTWNLLDLILLKHKYAFYVHTTSIIWRNIYKKRGSFLPPAFKKNFASGDVILAHMMLGKGGKLNNIPEVMSCYRVTGRGVWTSKSKKEQAEMNNVLEEKLRRATPVKYKLILHLQKLRSQSSIIKKLVPGPIND